MMMSSSVCCANGGILPSPIPGSVAGLLFASMLFDCFKALSNSEVFTA